MSRYDAFDFNRVTPISIHDRESKVKVTDLVAPMAPGLSFRDFFDRLPSLLAGGDFKAVVGHVAEAVKREKPVLWMMGAHVIKVGVSPLVIDMMERGVVQGLALNGAGVVHDVEMAYFGHTSEDVGQALEDGSFGMSRETAEIINSTVVQGAKDGLGMGEALGRKMNQEKPDHFESSLLGRAYALNIPVTVHVALGTDIVHQHPGASGSAIGDVSLRDFRIFTQLVSQLGQGGVALLFGSSVILPEVFLKALTVARNAGMDVSRFYTACFDMIRHYRPQANVVSRPTLQGGKGYYITGHHELMIPLLTASLLSFLASNK